MTAKKAALAAFSIFVAFSATYSAFQIATGFGIGWQFASLISSAVLVAVIVAMERAYGLH